MASNTDYNIQYMSFPFPCIFVLFLLLFNDVLENSIIGNKEGAYKRGDRD